MTFIRSARFAALLCGLVSGVQAETIQQVSLEGFLHWGVSTAPQVVLLSSSPGFTSSFDAAGFGSFAFAWTNETGAPLPSLSFTLFIDPDIDRELNGYFNEFGEFVSPLLPSLAPPGAIGFTGWEIDEPQYTFGNIYDHVWLGTLDNANGVPSSGPADDVSHALLFLIPQLLQGQTLTVTGTMSRTDAAGLAQHDPDSGGTLFINGYAVTSAAPSSEVPEPGGLAAMLLLTGCLTWCVRCAKVRA